MRWDVFPVRQTGKAATSFAVAAAAGLSLPFHPTTERTGWSICGSICGAYRPMTEAAVVWVGPPGWQKAENGAKALISSKTSTRRWKS